MIIILCRIFSLLLNKSVHVKNSSKQYKMYCELFSESTGLINLHFSLITTKIYLEEWDLGWAEDYIMEIYHLFV